MRETSTLILFWKAVSVHIALVAMMGNALAGDLFGGPVFSGNQSIVACEIVNVSNAPVHITSEAIFDKLGVNLSFNGDTCGSALSAFKACYYFVSVTGSSGVHTCFINIVEPNARVRATAHARTSSNITISESQMR